MKKLLVILISIFSINSHSENIPMNGVLGLICENNVYSLDYWEAKNIHNFSYQLLKKNQPSNSEMNFTSTYEARLKKYSSLSGSSIGLIIQMSIWLPPFISLTKNNINFIENFQIQDREISTVEFHPPNCKLDYIGYSIPLPNSELDELDFRFYIKKEYWDKLDYKNKVFTVSHFIMGAKLDGYFDQSEHAKFKQMRFLNALFLSDQLYSMTKDEFSELTNF